MDLENKDDLEDLGLSLKTMEVIQSSRCRCCRCSQKKKTCQHLEMDFEFIEMFFTLLLLTGDVLIYADDCKLIL